MNSRDTDGLRACQRDHAIEHARADGYLGGLCANRARRQVPAREHLQPPRRIVEMCDIFVSASWYSVSSGPKSAKSCH